MSSRRPWSKAEDEMLITLIQRFGDRRGRDGKWNEISKRLSGRTNKDCRKRWFHSLDPSLRKGRWTKEEDETLLATYGRLGPAWKEIARLIPGRKDDQCAKRYNDILDPKVENRLRPWTLEEDQYLTAKVSQLGHQWSTIAAGLSGRPPLTCRNRWRRLEKDIPKAGDSSLSPDDSSSSVPILRWLDPAHPSSTSLDGALSSVLQYIQSVPDYPGLTSDTPAVGQRNGFVEDQSMTALTTLDSQTTTWVDVFDELQQQPPLASNYNAEAYCNGGKDLSVSSLASNSLSEPSPRNVEFTRQHQTSSGSMSNPYSLKNARQTRNSGASALVPDAESIQANMLEQMAMQSISLRNHHLENISVTGTIHYHHHSQIQWPNQRPTFTLFERESGYSGTGLTYFM